MNIDDHFRKIANEEIDKRERPMNLAEIDTFCEKVGLCRTTVWKGRKNGTIKTLTIGKRVFIDLNQFEAK